MKGSNDNMEARVAAEKGTILGAALLLIATGANYVAQLRYIEGMTLVVTGILLIYIREHLKFHRWGPDNACWRRIPNSAISKRRK
ncbi:hypothetical protein ES703_72829 [subsurface metagenome]